MAKMGSERGSSERPGIGADILPGLDPETLTASLEQFFQASGKVMDHWRQMSDELCAFGKSRLMRNMEVNRKVARCGSINEALEAQAEFARGMMQDFIAESSKLFELNSRAIFESLSTWKAPTEAEEATKH